MVDIWAVKLHKSSFFSWNYKVDVLNDIYMIFGMIWNSQN